MLIFMTGLGPGIVFGGGNLGGGWRMAPLLVLLPLLLSSGLLSLPLHAIGVLMGVSGSGHRAYDPASDSWVEQQSDVWSLVLGLAIGAGVAIGFLKMTRTMRQEGAWATLRRVLFEGLQWGPAAAGQQGGGGGGGQQGQPGRGGPRSHAERRDAAIEAMQKLPLETFYTKEELMKMPATELRALARSAGVDAPRGVALQKEELAAAIAGGDGSSSALSCCVCCEDYVPGDVLRVLRCRHRFHCECIDRWLLSSCDFSRPAACPFCNAEL